MTLSKNGGFYSIVARDSWNARWGDTYFTRILLMELWLVNPDRAVSQKEGERDVASSLRLIYAANRFVSKIWSASISVL